MTAYRMIGIALAFLTVGAASSGVTVLVLRDTDPNAGAANLVAAKMLAEDEASRQAVRESGDRAWKAAQQARGKQ